MAPILAEHIPHIIQKYKKSSLESVNPTGSQALNISFFVVILAMGILSLPWFKSALPLPEAKAGLISTETPVKATQALLKANPPGQVFNAISFGSYLIWAAYPQYQVFVDSRIELFPENVWVDYLNISNATGDWEGQLDKYGVNTLMLSPTEQAALIQTVKQSDSWQELYADGTADIFIRK
jgi:hypothetical protein